MAQEQRASAPVQAKGYESTYDSKPVKEGGKDERKRIVDALTHKRSRSERCKLVDRLKTLWADGEATREFLGLDDNAELPDFATWLGDLLDIAGSQINMLATIGASQNEEIFKALDLPRGAPGRLTIKEAYEKVHTKQAPRGATKTKNYVNELEKRVDELRKEAPADDAGLLALMETLKGARGLVPRDFGKEIISNFKKADTALENVAKAMADEDYTFDGDADQAELAKRIYFRVVNLTLPILFADKDKAIRFAKLLKEEFGEEMDDYMEGVMDILYAADKESEEEEPK